jgi:hypothetical protein
MARVLKKQELFPLAQALIMKLACVGVLLIPLFLSGCATATATSTGGRDFDSSKVGLIQKGVTTTSQIVSWFGQPYKTEVASATEVKWSYVWAQATANATRVPFGGRTVDTTGTKKELYLFIKEDIVVNYTYQEGPFERHTKAR